MYLTAIASRSSICNKVFLSVSFTKSMRAISSWVFLGTVSAFSDIAWYSSPNLQIQIPSNNLIFFLINALFHHCLISLRAVIYQLIFQAFSSVNQIFNQFIPINVEHRHRHNVFVNYGNFFRYFLELQDLFDEFFEAGFSFVFCSRRFVDQENLNFSSSLQTNCVGYCGVRV